MTWWLVLIALLAVGAFGAIGMYLCIMIYLAKVLRW